MKKQIQKTEYFFVDESGDPIFYNRYGKLIVGNEGVSKTLILGFIKTDDPHSIRIALDKLRNEISKDSYLSSIPSVKKSLVSFHAKDDCPEVKEKVFRLIKDLNFSAEIFVGRKIPNIFNKRHLRKEYKFYDDLVSKLFENKLHISSNNEIYFAVRGSRVRQQPLENAINQAKATFEKKKNVKIDSNVNIYPQIPSGEPCLQVIDYIDWAVQRLFEKGQDRYFKFIEEKVKYIVDVYDSDRYPDNFYSKHNPLELKKISPL
jgi:hypothetical protein